MDAYRNYSSNRTLEAGTGWLRRPARPWRLTRVPRGSEQRRADARPPGRITRARAAPESSLLGWGAMGEPRKEDGLLLPALGYPDETCRRAENDITCRLVAGDVICHHEDNATCLLRRDKVTRVLAAVVASGKENLVRAARSTWREARPMPSRARPRRRRDRATRRVGSGDSSSSERSQGSGVVAAPTSGPAPPLETCASAAFEVTCPRALCPGRLSERLQPKLQWHERPRLAVPASFITATGGCGQDRRGLPGLFCPNCDACGAVQVSGRWLRLASLLHAEPSPPDGWWPVRSASERAALYLLSQHVYGSWERNARRGELRWQPVPLEDAALLLWCGGQAVGFASLKLRGQLLDGGPEYFMMDVLDTVYVRRRWRRRGHAGRLLQRLLSERAGRRLGVTRPVPAMWRLICAVLTAHPAARPTLFLVQWAGSEGYRTNAWQALRGHVQQHRRSDGSLDSSRALRRMLAGDWPIVHL